jgi:hypothetical protein
MALLKTNTGIGITNPSAALHVIGDGLFIGIVSATTFYGNLGGGVQGSVPYQSAINSTTFLSPGSAGQVLVTGGSGQNPYWSPASSLVGSFSGITIKDEGTLVGSALSVSSLNFVGANIVATASGADATITLSNDAQYLTGTAPASVISQSNGLNVTGSVNISGNLSVGGTSVILNAATLQIKDKDIVLGITTNALNQDISTDLSASHGGISIASTEGSPLINFPIEVGINSNPFTYKQLMWIKAGGYSGMGTDAWVSNYALSIGNTSTVANGSRLTVGTGFTVYDNLLYTRNIYSTGIITATQFVGSFSGNITGIASYATYSGISTYATNAGIATYATNAGIATYATKAGIATYATNSGIATYATNAGVSTSVIGGIGSLTQLQVTGISTFSNGPVLIGAATSTGTASQRLQVTGGAYVSGNLGVGIVNPTALLHCFAPDATNTVAYFRVTNSSVGSGLYRNVHIDGFHPNGASFWKGIDITPTQALVAPMTGIDMSWNQIYAEARGVNINVIKNTHSGGGNGIGVFSRVSASGVTDRAYEAIGGWFITDKETGALDPYTSYTLKVENRSTTGITNLVSFYTDSTTQRGSIYYDRTNNALTLSGNNAFRIDSNGSSRLFINSSGNIGVGTTSPTSKLTVIGDVLVSGVITATAFIGNIATAGIASTAINLQGGAASQLAYQVSPGITSFIANGTSGYLLKSNGTGVPTWVNPALGFNVDTANYATTAGISTSVIGGIGSITQLQVTGISTFSNGPVLIGAATSTGTASQPLQVTGGAYVSGNLGIGTTTPQAKLHVVGDTLVSGVTTTSILNVGTGGTIITTTGIGSVGIGTTSPQAKLHLVGDTLVTGITTSSWKGSEGTLFSIVNNLSTGSIFSICDISGIPSIDVDANGTIAISPYGNNLSKVGIGTTSPTSKLTVIGDVLVSGVITATAFIGNIATAGIASTAINLQGGAASQLAYQVSPGITSFIANGTSGYLLKSNGTGVPTWVNPALGFNVSNADYATNAGVSTSVIGGIGSLTQLQVTGISTFTNGPVLIGTATSTGTASQRLQVTGGAYVSGNLGVGTTTPQAKLTISSALRSQALGIGSEFIVSDTGSFVPSVSIAATIGSGTTEKVLLRSISRNQGTLDVVSNYRQNQMMNVSDTNSEGVFRVTALEASTVVGVTPIYRELLVVGESGIVTTRNAVAIATVNATGAGGVVGADIYGNVNIRSPFSTSTSYVAIAPNFRDNGALSFEAPIGAASTNSITQLFSITNNVSSSIFRINDLNRNPILEANIAGNIGIGTTSPQRKLEVQGITRITSVGSTANEQIDIRHYRNISGFATVGMGSTSFLPTNNSGAISFESPVGYSSFPASLFAIVNDPNGSVFSVAGFNPQRFASDPRIPALEITQGGNVGLGITNPVSKFHIIGNTRIDANVGIGTTIVDTSRDFTSSTGVVQRLSVQIAGAARITSLGSTTLSQIDIKHQSNPGINTLAPSRGAVFFDGLTDTFATNVDGGQLVTITNDNTSSIFAVNRFVPGVAGLSSANPTNTRTIETVVNVTSSGNIGIGTTNPTSKLSVVGNVLVSGIVTATTFVGNLTGTSTTATNVIGGIGSITQLQVTGISTFSNGPVLIGAATSTGTASQRLQVTGGAYVSGNLGIGTTNPQAKLDVTDDALIGGLTVGKGTGSVSSNTALGYQALLGNTTGTLNTATGYQALKSNTTGNYNTANGYRALFSNTTGGNNTANGYGALNANTTGTSNTATGTGALQSNTIGTQNTATGDGALQSNTTGTLNTATGYQALYSNTTGTVNTANGWRALHSNTTGSRNTATGYQALYSNTTGIQNTATGASALYFNTTGTLNTATGYQALYSNTTGTNNTANGWRALQSNTTGSNNTATGYYALYSNTTGYINTATGRGSLYSNTTGVQNTANGYNAGYNITTGSNNTFLGYDAQPSSATVSNEITLGDTNVDTLRVPGLGYYGVRTNTTVATTYITTIDSITVATYRSARIQIQITQGSNYQVSDVLLIHDGTTASIIEYGTLATGSTLGTYSATISSGNALLQVNMGSATSSSVKVLSYRTVV